MSGFGQGWKREDMTPLQRTLLDAAMGMSTHSRPSSMPQDAHAMSESDMQANLETWLQTRGVYRMTAKNYTNTLSGIISPIGFFAHWPHKTCIGAPQVSDLVIVAWPNSKPPLFLELKSSEKAEWQPGQKAAVSIGLWKTAFSCDEAKRVIDEFLGKPNAGRTFDAPKETP